MIKFFELISAEDKLTLQRKFKRLGVSIYHHHLRFSSIIRILWQIRNDAAHGEEFWSFSLADPTRRTKYTNQMFSTITNGRLGKKKRKSQVTLEIKLTYEELRDIFVRTAIENIRAEF